MKKVLMLFAVGLIGISATAQESKKIVDDWDSNWFLSVKGGVSAFVGKPIGHGDLFDREKPLMNAAVGKWFSPTVGGRIAYQGMQLIDADIESRSYQSVHADFLYNLLGRENAASRWDIIPYAGCGIIRNSYTHQKPFAISYGIIGRYKLTERLHLTGELGGTTTWQDFDGQGASNKLGDNLLQASVGLSVTIGKSHANSHRLHRYTQSGNESFSTTDYTNHTDFTYSNGDGDYKSTSACAHKRNDYSGLNKLRERLKNKNWDGNEPLDDITDSSDSTGFSDKASAQEYLQVIKSGKKYIGAPIFFFFKIGKHELTEQAQIINVTEVAKVIKKYGLQARIIGAADSQTGSAELNEQLSAERANYIAELLKTQGVVPNQIETQHRGGIDSYEPLTGNRNTCVVLYFK